MLEINQNAYREWLKGLNIAAVARETGLSTRTLSNFVNNKGPATMRTLERIEAYRKAKESFFAGAIIKNQ